MKRKEKVYGQSFIKIKINKTKKKKKKNKKKKKKMIIIIIISKKKKIGLKKWHPHKKTPPESDKNLIVTFLVRADPRKVTELR